MKIYILILIGVAALMAAGCEKDTFYDTGLANGVHDCSVWEYMQKGHGNWDSVRIMIRKAGLVELFDGKDADCPEMTVFGLTDLSIIQFLLKTMGDDRQPLYRCVADIPDAMCREILLSYVIPGKYVRTDFPYEVQGTLEGGKVFTTLSGLQIRVFRTKGSWKGLPGIGPDGIGIHFLESGHTGYIASGDITTHNAIVHSMSSIFQMADPVVRASTNVKTEEQ